MCSSASWAGLQWREVCPTVWEQIFQSPRVSLQRAAWISRCWQMLSLCPVSPGVISENCSFFESVMESENLFWSRLTSPECLCCRIEGHTKSLSGCFWGSCYGNSHNCSYLRNAEIFVKELPFSTYSRKKAAIGCADPTITQIPAKHLQAWICQRSQIKAFLFPLPFLYQTGISFLP